MTPRRQSVVPLLVAIALALAAWLVAGLLAGPAGGSQVEGPALRAAPVPGTRPAAPTEGEVVAALRDYVAPAARRLPLRRWEPRLVQVVAGPPGRSRATVRIGYRLPGDLSDATVTTEVDLAAGREGLVVTGLASTPLPPWEVAGLRSARSGSALVLGTGPLASLEAYARESAAAAASVGDLLGREPVPVVLVVPPDWATGRRMVAAPAPLDALAAVAAPLEGATSGPTGTAPGPVRVVADPAVLRRLAPGGRAALLGHEVFHVATGSHGGVPLWLSEGLADYAGYRGTRVPVQDALAGLLAAARRGGVPRHLPADADFADPERAAVAYEGAHLAVRLLVQAAGEERVLSAYQEVARRGPDSLAAVLERRLDTSQERLAARWRAEVARRAAA